MIDPEQMKDHRVEIVHVDWLLNGPEPNVGKLKTAVALRERRRLRCAQQRRETRCNFRAQLKLNLSLFLMLEDMEEH